MKFSEWYEFNCVCEQRPIIQNYNVAFVEIFSCLSYKTDDIIFTGEATLKNINHLFGDYNIFMFCGFSDNSSRATFKIFLYPPFLKEKSN